VILSVCVSVRKKRMWTKVFKLGIRNDIGISYKWYDFGFKRSNVKVAGSQSAKRRSSGRRELCTSIECSSSCFSIIASAAAISSVHLLGNQSVTAKDLLSEAWSSYWTVTSRRSVETAVMYIVMTLLLTACPAACVYYSVRCTRLINSLYQYTHSLDNQTKVNYWRSQELWLAVLVSQLPMLIDFCYSAAAYISITVSAYCTHSHCALSGLLKNFHIGVPTPRIPSSYAGELNSARFHFNCMYLGQFRRALKTYLTGSAAPSDCCS